MSVFFSVHVFNYVIYRTSLRRLFSHLRTGKEYDSALLRTEDVTKSSAKICRHKLQNFDGKHEDINAVYVYFLTKCNYSCFEL